jgi:hypothetical protein
MGKMMKKFVLSGSASISYKLKFSLFDKIKCRLIEKKGVKKKSVLLLARPALGDQMKDHLNV